MFNIYKAQFIPEANSKGTPSLDDLLVAHKMRKIDENGNKIVFYEFKPAERRCYLYRHIRLDTNEVFYVGVGTKKLSVQYTCQEVEYRRAFEKTNRNIIWNRIVNKTDYRVEIMLDNLTLKEVFEKEIEFIALYGRKNLNTGSLANLSKGGEDISFSIAFSIPTSKKRSYTRSKESIEKGKLKKLNYVTSEETKRKMSESGKKRYQRMGNPHSDKPKYTNIKQFDKNWNFIKIWDTAKEIRKNFSNFSVRKGVDTGILYKNFYWTF